MRRRIFVSIIQRLSTDEGATNGAVGVNPIRNGFARLVGLYLLLSGVAVGRSEEIDLPKLARETRPAVVLLTVFGVDGKEVATGTGFFISPDGKLVTNWHVAKDAHSIEGHLEEGAKFKVSGVLANSPKEDVALLQAEPGKFLALPLGSVANVEVGSRVAVIGSPLGLEGTLSEGIVSAKRKLGGDEAWLQITAPISPGSSGSPVLNAKGEVVGVATLHLRGSQALNFAAPIDAVKRLIEEAASGNVLKTFAEVRRVAAADIWEDSRVKAALAAIQSGDYVEALSQLQLVLEEHPDKGELWHLQGAVFANLEFFKDAIASLKKANELKADMAENWLTLSTCQLRLGELDAAMAAAQTAVKLKPKYFNAWANIGDCYIQKQEWTSAESAFRQAIRIDPQNADGLRHLGWCLKNQQRLNEALECYEKVATLDPRDPKIWNSIAYVHLVQQRPKPAIEALKKAVELKPDFDDAWNNLATASSMAGNSAAEKAAADKLRDLGSPAYAGAIRRWQAGQEKAAPKGPKAEEAARFFASGEATLKAGQFDKAIAAYRQAVKREPKNGGYGYGLGVAHGRKGEEKDAINCFNETVKLDPAHADGWRSLGVAFQKQGKILEAKNAAEQAIRIDPNHALAWNDLGALLMNARNLEQASGCFQMAVKVQPSYELAWRNLAVVWCELGREGEARRIHSEMSQRGSPLATEVAAALSKNAQPSKPARP